MKFQINYFRLNNILGGWLRYFLWKCPQMYVSDLYWWLVNISWYRQPMLTQICVAIWRHSELNHRELDSLFYSSFGLATKKTSKLRVPGPLWWESEGPVLRKGYACHDVIVGTSWKIKVGRDLIIESWHWLYWDKRVYNSLKALVILKDHLEMPTQRSSSVKAFHKIHSMGLLPDT